MPTEEELRRLKDQISRTIVSLAKEPNPEKEHLRILSRYMDIAKKLEFGDISSLNGILNLARGYLEKTSVWDKAFLNEMAKTEAMVKTIL